MTAINSEFGKELKKFGTFDFNACYNCGNCTAICSLTNEQESFPRNMVRYSVLGLKDEITSSLKPWLCYYCGDCSTHCPQEAFPGELMMSLRRWLTSRYDWTKLSGLFYKSLTGNVIAFLLVIAGVYSFAAYNQFRLIDIMHAGHLFEIAAIVGVFIVILVPNIFRMWWFTIKQPGYKIPLTAYLQSLRELFVHMFTQKRSLGCNNDIVRWFEHFILVIGYLTLLFTTVFLDWFSTPSGFVVILGYIVSADVLVITFHFTFERLRKKKEQNRFSQPSDWLFVIWLFLIGFSAYLVRVFVDLQLLDHNVWLYLVHLIVLAQWALILVPFGKWTHFLYRSFAMYFERLIAYSGRLTEPSS
jgi:ferredoxin